MYKIQAATSAWDYERTQKRFNEGDKEDIIFPNKSEAKLFMQLYKLVNGALPTEVKLRYIFTPDVVENKREELPENTFDYLNGNKITLNVYGTQEKYYLDKASLSYNDFGDYSIYRVSIWAYKDGSRSILDNMYNLSYELKLGNFRKTKKENLEFGHHSLGGKGLVPVNIGREPDIMALIDEIRSKFK